MKNPFSYALFFLMSWTIAAGSYAQDTYRMPPPDVAALVDAPSTPGLVLSPDRSLMPFGFQAEPRNIWEAPDTYITVSPFFFAHQIKAPILFIHGEADNNTGTFPIQSERMYQAVRGVGNHRMA